jgi:signal transduction histidine kinase
VGLGLSICRSIVKTYGGSISLESLVDMGTMVTLRFPESRLAAAETAPLQRSWAAQ